MIGLTGGFGHAQERPLAMNSKIHECYVFATLPEETQFVIAGRFLMDNSSDGIPIGRFVYGKSYLDRPNAIPIDPVELQLTDKEIYTTRKNGIFNSLRDSGPDSWGRQIVERKFQDSELGEIDYLLSTPDDRVGALGFNHDITPPKIKRQFKQLPDLVQWVEVVEKVKARNGLETIKKLNLGEDLELIGTSMGGARPKTIVQDAEDLWLVKFDRPKNMSSQARIEHAMLKLAEHCGIHCAESKVESIEGHDVLLVKRFDRKRVKEGYRRFRLISALTLLKAGESHSEHGNWSYILLADELSRISASPESDAKELFRRMVFNALISNNDDHPRNHAVIANPDNWQLSPAYDLTPSTPVSIEERFLAMECGAFGRIATKSNLLSKSRHFYLKQDEAEKLIDEMTETIETFWYGICRKYGVGEDVCESIKDAFAYPGFHYKLGNELG